MKMLYAFVLVMASARAEAADISSGSGVVIGARGEILTNSHVVEACTEINVQFSSRDSGKAVLVARDEKNDLAVVRANKPSAAIAAFRDGPPVRTGDTVIALGYPLSGLLASTGNLSLGNVSALAGLGDDSRYLQISAPVQPGNSGGPLLDASGHLIGIVTAKLNAARVAKFTGDIPQNVNFALKGEVAQTFLDSKSFPYQKVHSDQKLSPADVGDIALPFTVHIECNAGEAPVAAIEPSQLPRATLEDPQITDHLRWCGNFAVPPDMAIAACNRAIAIVKGINLALVYTQRGLQQSRLNNLNGAISDFRAALKLAPKYSHAYVSRAITNLKFGNVDDAVIDFNVALKLNPYDAKALFGRGLAKFAKQDVAGSLEDRNAAKAIQSDIEPSGSSRHRQLAQAQRR
jgi:Trypsin-like peptidase domain